ncbi:MAG: SRPBCC family protein [Mycobacterium sp.]
MTNSLQGTLENRDGAWVLTLVRDIAHPVERVWPWLVEPDRLRRWSPIVPDKPLDDVGPRQVRENPGDEPVTGDVIAVDPPHELQHRWGDDDVVRWRLEPTATGCRLTLEQSMRDRDKAAMNAAGWQICLDVLEETLAGTASGRVVGQDAERHDWESLRDRYAKLLGV